MAEAKDDSREYSLRRLFAWTELFQTFQVALDPKKLVLAAAGIVTMWAGWWLLSVTFYNSVSQPKPDAYTTKDFSDRYPDKKPEEVEALRLQAYRADLARWVILHRAAGKGDVEVDRYKTDGTALLDADGKPAHEKIRGGEFRVLPWDEQRGPNPFLLATGQTTLNFSEPGTLAQFVTTQAKVLLEPLRKFLMPIIYMVSPGAGGLNRLYFLLLTLWSVVTWAFFGGVITRLAVVQLAGKDQVGMRDAVRFVASRYTSYLSAPLVPLALVAFTVVGLILYGFVHLIPILGDVVDGIVYPLIILAGLIMTVLLVGLIAYPLMFPTVSAEGSDALDALSRSYQYLFTSPWNYLFYGLVSVLYGAVLVFFVVFMGSLIAYLGKWGLSQNPVLDAFSWQRETEYLYVYAPDSFGWRELLLKDNPAVAAQLEAPEPLAQYKSTFRPWNWVGAFLVGLVLTVFFLLMLGFSYSYFWTASSMVFLLMRRKVDDTELDEVYLEEDEPEEPIGVSAPSPAPAPPGGPSVQMVDPPALRSAPAPAATPELPASPPPPTTVAEVKTVAVETRSEPITPAALPPVTESKPAAVDPVTTDGDAKATADKAAEDAKAE